MMRSARRSRIDRLDDALRRRNLSRGVAGALVAGVVLVVGALGYFAELVEDVTYHNDLVTSDRAHLAWFVAQRTDTTLRLSRLLDHVVSPFFLWSCACLAAAALWWTGRRLFVALAPALSLALAGVVTAVVKLVVARNRPPARMAVVVEHGSSFPAAHVSQSAALLLASAFVVAVFVLRRNVIRALVVGGGVLAVGVVAASRVLLGVHWLSDVIAGALLGLAIALAITILAVLVDAMAPSDWPVRRLDPVWRLLNHRRPVLRRAHHPEATPTTA